jgi:hypothetical protein
VALTAAVVSIVRTAPSGRSWLVGVPEGVFLAGFRGEVPSGPVAALGEEEKEEKEDRRRRRRRSRRRGKRGRRGGGGG